jgi:hypothetical protein
VTRRSDLLIALALTYSVRLPVDPPCMQQAEAATMLMNS